MEHECRLRIEAVAASQHAGYAAQRWCERRAQACAPGGDERGGALCVMRAERRRNGVRQPAAGGVGARCKSRIRAALWAVDDGRLRNGVPPLYARIWRLGE